jgi:hypothetical protein
MLVVKSSKLRFMSLISHLIFRAHQGKSLGGLPVRGVDFLFPYVVSLDAASKQIMVEKRNWFLIGVDAKSFNFGQVRNVFTDEHFLTSRRKIEGIGGLHLGFLDKKGRGSETPRCTYFA